MKNFKKLLCLLIAIIMVTSMFSISVNAGVGDKTYNENESNDSFYEANIIYNDYTVSGDLYDMDMDHFVFTITKRSEITFLCQSKSSVVLVGIWDEDDDCIAAGETDYSKGYYYDKISTTLSAGTYYIIIFNSERYYSTDYLFYFECEATEHTCEYYLDEIVEPTCYEEGYSIYSCFCGDYYIEDYTYPRHKYSSDSAMYCSECGYERPTLKKENGLWKYYEDGVFTKVTTLVKYKGVWFYVKNGVWDDDARTVVKYQGVWFYIEKGRWNATATTLVKYNSNWLYVKNGRWNKGTTLVKYQGVWFYVENGVWNKQARTLVKKDKCWFFVNKGKWDKSAETVVKYNGVWFYVKDGRWDKDVDTLIKYNGNWLYIKDGKWNKSTTTFKFKGVKFKIVKGVAQV